MKTVPVGRCLMRFPSPDNVLSLMVVWELCLDLAGPIWESFGDEFKKCVCFVLWALQVTPTNWVFIETARKLCFYVKLK